MTALHIVPAQDVVDHEPSSHCICGPTAQPVRCRDGSDAWLYLHHRLLVETADQSWTWMQR
jgi:hypothetical protein